MSASSIANGKSSASLEVGDSCHGKMKGKLYEGKWWCMVNVTHALHSWWKLTTVQEQFLDGIYTPDFLDEMHDESGSEYEEKHAAPANKKVNQMVSLRWNISVKFFTVYFLYFKIRRTKVLYGEKKVKKAR